jgi:uncharacterized damage-inducible protein DinB
MADSPRPPETELAALRQWFRYMAAARSVYLESFDKLSEETLRKDRGASFPTVLDIFAHALRAHRSWVAFAYVDAPETDAKSTGWTLPETRELANEVAATLETFLSTLTPADLDRTFTFHFVPGDERTRATYTTRQMLWHLVEEEVQHRGEINALLWQDDIDPPIYDWIDWTKTLPNSG